MWQYRHRIIFLSKPVDEELGNQLVATMLYLDSENQKDLNLYINCSGGNVRTFTPFFAAILLIAPVSIMQLFLLQPEQSALSVAR